MKFINYLENIVTIWVIRADNGFIDHMKNIPLDNNTEH